MGASRQRDAIAKFVNRSKENGGDFNATVRKDRNGIIGITEEVSTNTDLTRQVSYAASECRVELDVTAENSQ
ncbi:MAG: hypothetical protein JO033_04530 [Acidobacteriaceae bacterium]|nr:hypothetical protein [Acidobacteriaceae bacterium]